MLDNRRRALETKRYLRCMYQEWAQLILANCHKFGTTLEIGATNPITSEVFAQTDVIGLDVAGIGKVAVRADATELPVRTSSLANIIAIDTFHHIQDAHRFLEEVTRTLKPGGRLILIEPWISRWSTLMFRMFHHEPLDTHTDWYLFGSDPMARANIALPWIVFSRDAKQLSKKFPILKVKSLEKLMPISLLLSGGSKSRLGAPMFLYKKVRLVEHILELRGIGMQALIVVEKHP